LNPVDILPHFTIHHPQASAAPQAPALCAVRGVRGVRGVPVATPMRYLELHKRWGNSPTKMVIMLMIYIYNIYIHNVYIRTVFGLFTCGHFDHTGHV